MRLQLVDQSKAGIHVPCCKCHNYCGGMKPSVTRPDNRVWADVDGIPFESYYCPKCAGNMKLMEIIFPEGDKQ